MTAATIETRPVPDVIVVVDQPVDRCPICHSHDEGCTPTVCHGLDSD